MQNLLYYSTSEKLRLSLMRNDENLIIVDFNCAKAMAKIPEYKDDFFEGTSGKGDQIRRKNWNDWNVEHNSTQE
jgi:hypothetical protein